MRKVEALALAKLIGYVKPVWFKCRQCQRHILEDDGAEQEDICWDCFGHRGWAIEDRWMVVPARGRNATFMRGGKEEL